MKVKLEFTCSGKALLRWILMGLLLLVEVLAHSHR
jgi:hypothetical protein